MTNTEGKKIYLIRSTNEENNAFVGVRIRNDSIEFHYPESYDLSGIEDVTTIKDISLFRRDMIDILQTISLAKTCSSTFQKTENGVCSVKNFTLLSYLWIIRDFITNGIYRNRDKIYKNNAKGKVVWKKTLKTQPIISNGNVIYNNLVVEVNNDYDSVITEAHMLCVYDSIRKAGWLFGISDKSFYVLPPTNSLIKKYIRTINSEIKKTFDDLKKVRLNHMLKVLSGVDDSKQVAEIIYGVDKYHYVYEKMIDAVLGNVIDIKKYNPNSSWFILRDKSALEEIEASSLRPDTIYIDKNTKTAYVIDAKYYRYGTTSKTEDLPGTTSIQKQITYATNIKTNLKQVDNIVDIHNVFVLPYNKNNNICARNNNLEYIGFSKANWIDNTSESVVHAFLIDTKHLISSWAKGNCKDDIDVLINDIEKYSNNHINWKLVNKNQK